MGLSSKLVESNVT